MKEIELLDAIGGVRDCYILDAQQCREIKVPRRRAPVKIMLAAAILAVLLAGCTYAVLRLQDLKMGEYATPVITEETLPPLETASQTAPEPTEESLPATTAPEPWDVISLQGFAGSPGYLASKEWYEFTSSYDQNMKLLTQSYEIGFETPEAYFPYNCYTQEMMDKVDELCQTYDLKLLGKMWIVADIPSIFKAVDIDGVWAAGAEENFRFLESYCYEDGTFQLTGDLNLPGRSDPTYFSIRNSMKGSLDPVYTIVQPETYDQWNYTMSDGSEILLAVREESGMIIADREEFFAAVSVGNYDFSDDPAAARKELEAIAENFTFSYHPSRADTSVLEDAQQEREKKWEAQEAKLQADHDAQFKRDSYADIIRDRLNDPTIEDRGMQYVLLDITGDGQDELLTGFQGNIYEIFLMKNACTDLAVWNHFEHWELENRVLKLCEGNVLMDVFKSDLMTEYGFCHLKQNKTDYYDSYQDYFDYLVYSPNEKDPWSRRQSVRLEKIYEKEALDVLNSYTPVELDWKPITEFPMN